MNQWFERQWQGFTAWHFVLIPLSWLFFIVTLLRRFCYRHGLLKSTRLSVPVIVVGNITVGGTGKTPFVVYLAEQLLLAGFFPGIVSRGYGRLSSIVSPVGAYSLPSEVGDEALLIARRTRCPMFVGVHRVAAAQALLQSNPKCNVIISDDGLQHYALQRDVEIALIDAHHGFGNRRLLPAGPLREGIARLKLVDIIVGGGAFSEAVCEFADGQHSAAYTMQVHGKTFVSVSRQAVIKEAHAFTKQDLVAIAGIAHPERFFKLLTDLGLTFQRHVFADHHAFSEQDFKQFAGKTILMTEKDAVKCFVFNLKDAWYLPITITVDAANQPPLIQRVSAQLEKIKWMQHY